MWSVCFLGKHGEGTDISHSYDYEREVLEESKILALFRSLFAALLYSERTPRHRYQTGDSCLVALGLKKELAE